MTNEHDNAALALLTALDAPDWARLAASARWAVEARLAKRHVPGELVAHVLADGERELLWHLRSSPDVTRDHPRVAEGAPDVPPAERWAEMSTFGARGYRDWERLLADCDPRRPEWQELKAQEISGGLYFGYAPVLALSPFREHYEWALRRAAARLTLREQARVLVSVQRDSGVGEVAAVTARYDLPIRDRAMEALAGRGIEALAAEFEGTGAAIEQLRAAGEKDAGGVARERADLDWTLIARAHAEEPFAAAVSAALCARDDCPEELRVALFTAHPGVVAEKYPDPPAALFSLPLKGAARTKALRTLTARFLKAERVAELIAHARPAAGVLEASRRADPLEPSVWRLQPVHAVVGRVLAATVGQDAGAWRALRRLLKGYKGTVAELCAKAAAEPDPGSAWPEAEALPPADAKPSLTGARKAFVVLLDAAGVETQLALLPHLDERTAADLFTHGVRRREWFEFVVGHGTPALRQAFVRARGKLDVGELQRLFDLDEPDLAGALALRRPMSSAQVAHVMSGRAFAAHVPGGQVYPAELRERFLATTGGWTGRHAVTCADPEVQRHILRHVRVRGIVPQLRLLLDLWERAGKAAMLALVEADLDPLKYTRAEFQGGVVKRVRKMAEADDEEAEKEALRAYLAERETPAWQIKRLGGSDNFHRESHGWFLAEIAASPARNRLGLLSGSGEGHVAAGDPTPRRALEAGATLAETLAMYPSTDPDDTRRWLVAAVSAGLVTWAEAFAVVTPASHVLAATVDDAPDRWLPDLRDVVPGLDLSAEAQLVALRLLRDFAGTVPELLATAVAVTA
ncbi:hypothetical protein [Phytomonospora endophytica]|uniref:Uncharacterized protein n=1 Tax=Phytomonospora endophytica TaxID=714109 RepID=A0A841FTA3_9ACTN|nr:hypothetical protein [Phytomonospora endophytica]MBB6035210.1 hypothetical protein [Phytomonospora endophytica]GIG64041.1 hypothetical protein Pen01_03360 [Phytomonospora endophytica]